ncbi:MAG: hypothetical protein M3Q75_03570 [Gemmatimonadota bacterium]|nr:hypothetical protein [Gemmatimonadota bacterium]
MLTALLGLACTERRTAPLPDSADPATLAAREARRQAFLAEQEAETREALVTRRFRAELVFEHRTVVAFYPAWRQGSDSFALRQRLSQYAAVAQHRGWYLEERYSGELRLTDPRSHAFYAVPVSPDSVGLLLAAPGYPPVVWYGEIAVEALNERLGSLHRWFPGTAAVTPDQL